MSYTIDIFRNKTKPVYNFFDFALYLSFFPQLVAGPIERSHKLLPQIIKPRKFKDINFLEGLYFVIFWNLKSIQKCMVVKCQFLCAPLKYEFRENTGSFLEHHHLWFNQLALKFEDQIRTSPTTHARTTPFLSSQVSNQGCCSAESASPVSVSGSLASVA